jgi:enoyl-CoA hydratase/carnithine racemase
VTGWSGTVSTPSTIGTFAARAVLIGGQRIDSPSALKLGLVSRVASDCVAGAAQTALEISRLHPSRLSLWRRLRGRHFVDRFRASVIHKL